MIRSRRKIALSRMVKNALNCKNTEDIPGLKPWCMARLTTHQIPTANSTPYTAMAATETPAGRRIKKTSGTAQKVKRNSVNK
ncbi:hypothetical protein D3C78_1585120 [compost metagenome]